MKLYGSERVALKRDKGGETIPLFIDSRLIIVALFFFFYNYMWYVCECTVGVDVGDGSTSTILSNVAMGCIVLGRQMNVYFGIECINTTIFVGMNVRFCTMKIHDSTII
jgi:hypothetical protein